MRKLIMATLVLILIGSLVLNGMYMYEDLNTTSIYDVPSWTSEEYEILERVYRELVARDEIPLGVYPYEVVGDPDGYTIRFQIYEFLQLRATPFGRGGISDGCVFYHFNENIELTGVTRCG